MGETKQIAVIHTDTDLKIFLAKNYMNQIKNFFGDEKQAMKFLSSVMTSVQKLPALLECEPMSIVNSFMTMAQLGLMPSDVSGEAYVLPYKGKNGNKAQFQLGYQGIITLFYRAGGNGIRAEVVRKNDKFSCVNGKINHEIDIFQSNADRGEVIGAYAIAKVNGEEISKMMNIKDIIEIGKNFSKSFDTSFTPWKVENDPEGWMYKKTVLKQLAKLMPKNETINKAIEYDNQDSRISEAKGLVAESNLQMGNILKPNGKEKTKENKDKTSSSESTQNSAEEH
jgi:recombination protein RecT